MTVGEAGDGGDGGGDGDGRGESHGRSSRSQLDLLASLRTWVTFGLN